MNWNPYICGRAKENLHGAKENLHGASLKYLFVYFKIRIFKSSYRNFNSLHQMTGPRFELEVLFLMCSGAILWNISGFNCSLLGWSFRIPEASGIKSKVYSQSFLAAVCGQHNSFPRQCGYQWRSMKWQDCGLTGLPGSSKESSQPTWILARTGRHPWHPSSMLCEAVLGGAFKKKTAILAPVIEKQWVATLIQGIRGLAVHAETFW